MPFQPDVRAGYERDGKPVPYTATYLCGRKRPVPFPARHTDTKAVGTNACRPFAQEAGRVTRPLHGDVSARREAACSVPRAAHRYESRGVGCLSSFRAMPFQPDVRAESERDGEHVPYTATYPRGGKRPAPIAARHTHTKAVGSDAFPTRRSRKGRAGRETRPLHGDAPRGGVAACSDCRAAHSALRSLRSVPRASHSVPRAPFRTAWPRSPRRPSASAALHFRACRRSRPFPDVSRNLCILCISCLPDKRRKPRQPRKHTHTKHRMHIP